MAYIKKSKNESFDFQPDKKIVVFVCGNHIEARQSSAISNVPKDRVRKISSKQYIDTETGEIKEYRCNSCKPIRNSIAELSVARRQIYSNFDTGPQCLISTLTYFNNMTSYKKIGVDLHNFHAEIRKKIGPYEYIDFVEYGNNQSFHCHELMKFNTENPDKKTIANCWHNKGPTEVKAIEEIDRVVSYLTSFAIENPRQPDIDIDIWNYDSSVFKSLSEEEQNYIKHFVKQKRLFFLPPNMRIHRCSKCIVTPSSMILDYNQFQELINGHIPYYSQKIIVKESQGVKITHQYLQYNMLS